jgi:cation:H+ antiporter
MPDLLLWSLVFVFSLVALIISADFFVKASERIGLASGVSPFVIGITLVALGTSLPELVTSIAAVLNPNDVSEIVIGNVIGSNITNLGLVLGLVAILAKRIRLEFDVMKVDVPMMLGATFLLYLAVKDLHFSLIEALLCLVGMGTYLAYVINLSRQEDGASVESPLVAELEIDLTEAPDKVAWRDVITLIGSGAVIYFSAKYNVIAIEELATLLDIGKEFIALTVVALGTSLPELVVSIAAVRTDNAEMAVGNVLGSNIFNIFAVMGIPRLFGPLSIPESVLPFSLPLLVGSTLLCVFILQDREINRWEGTLLFLLYLLFIINLATQEAYSA